MFIIPLVGKSNSGKTSCIKYLIIKMLEIEEVEVLYTSKFSSSKTNKNELMHLIKEPWDGKNASLDITVFLKYKEKLIYITTNGDYLKDILRNLNNMIKKHGKIDICVCGRHECNDVEKEFLAYHIDNVVCVDKERATNSDFDKENQNTANKLFSEIEKIVQMR